MYYLTLSLQSPQTECPFLHWKILIGSFISREQTEQSNNSKRSSLPVPIAIFCRIFNFYVISAIVYNNILSVDLEKCFFKVFFVFYCVESTQSNLWLTKLHFENQDILWTCNNWFQDGATFQTLLKSKNSEDKSSN